MTQEPLMSEEEKQNFQIDYQALMKKYGVQLRPLPKLEHMGNGKYIINADEMAIEKLVPAPVISPLNDEIQEQATTDSTPEEGSKGSGGEPTTV